jgi:hypothetical protein
MSWSVSASGTPDDVMTEIHRQLKAGPLAHKPAGLSDDGERETVRHISETINQCLETFDPEQSVSVAAHGNIAFDNSHSKTGARQTVALTITPIPSVVSP